MSDDTLDLSSLELPDEVKEQIIAQYNQKVSGLKTNKQDILTQLTQVKNEANALKSQFEGVDLETLKSLAQKLKQDEELQLLAEGKHDVLFERKVEPLKQKYESELAEYKSKLAKRDAATLNGGLLANISTSGVDPQAVEGVLAIAKSKFNALDDNLNPIAKDENGEVVYGASGKPLTPQEWLNQLRETNPFYWGVAQGAGAKTNIGGGYQEKKKEDYTVAEMKQLRTENPELYNQLFPLK